ncbi:hypothetical protein MMC14_008970 [Varicellaria rhodocarpa]|nr:hypothetical protein [Varicellaria rhodocarpa]
MLELNLIDEAVQTVPRNETMVGLLREIGDRLVRIEKNNTNNTGEAKTPILVPGAEQVENSHEYELVSNAKNEVEVTAGLADAENSLSPSDTLESAEQACLKALNKLRKGPVALSATAYSKNGKSVEWNCDSSPIFQDRKNWTAKSSNGIGQSLGFMESTLVFPYLPSLESFQFQLHGADLFCDTSRGTLDSSTRHWTILFLVPPQYKRNSPDDEKTASSLHFRVLYLVRQALFYTTESWDAVAQYVNHLLDEAGTLISPKDHDRLLFNDPTLKLSRLYFWAINVLSTYIDRIQEVIEAFDTAGIVYSALELNKVKGQEAGLSIPAT